MPRPHLLLQCLTAASSISTAACFHTNLRAPAFAALWLNSSAAAPRLPAAAFADMALAATHVLAEDCGRPRPALLDITIPAALGMAFRPTAENASALLECRASGTAGGVEVSAGGRICLTATAAAWQAAGITSPVGGATAPAQQAALWLQEIPGPKTAPTATAAMHLVPEAAHFAVSCALQATANLQQTGSQRRIPSGKLPHLAACSAMLPTAAGSESAAQTELFVSASVRLAACHTSLHELVCSHSASHSSLLSARGLTLLQKKTPGSAGWLTAGAAAALQTTWLSCQPQTLKSAAAAATQAPARWVLLSAGSACPLSAICDTSAADPAAAVAIVSIVFRPTGAVAAGQAATAAEGVQVATTEAEVVKALLEARPDHVFCIQQPASEAGTKDCRSGTRGHAVRWR